MSKSQFMINENRCAYISKDNKIDKSQSSGKNYFDDNEQMEAAELYRKAVKYYKRFIQSDFSVFSKQNTILDLLIRNEAELALIQNYRIAKYNDKLAESKSLYRKIVRKK